jgi:Ni/Co efflux regulator RcnB
MQRTECRARLVVYWIQAINRQEGIMDKKHLIIPALLAALMGASAPSFAQDRYHGDRDRSDRYSQRDNDRYNQRDRDNNRRNSDRRDDRRDGYQARGGGRAGNEGWGEERRWDGAGPDHSFRRGDRLPSRYRNHQYVVNNYREHHLRPPPRGYHWVQTGGDYVLTAIATGIIADLIINH